MVAPPSPPYLGPAPHTGLRTNKPIRRIVIHCTAGAEPGVSGAARDTVKYTKTSGVVSSYHYVVDAKESLQLVYDSVVAYHCGTNDHSIGYELCCSLAGQGQGHWKRDDHQAMLKLAAEDVARLCLAYEVPMTRLGVTELKAGRKGITGHVDMRDAFGNTTHWDPGPHFPWDQFISMVRAAADRLTMPDPPKPAPVPPTPTPVVPTPAAPVKQLGVHLCLAGDWNEGPHSTGRHTPAWIARKGGLTVYPPPAGGKGHHNIDYPLSSAPVGDIRRLEEPLSDHDPIVFTVTHPQDGRVLRGCTFNVMRDRTPEQRTPLARWLEYTGTTEGIDFYALQEIRQYHGLLRGVDGYTFLGATTPNGVEHNGLLVRHGISVRGLEAKLTSKVGWVTMTGGNHDPSSIVVATLDGWLRVASVHEAPTVNWVDKKPVGPARRVAVRVASARSLANIGRFWKARR